ncbi:MAG: dienelactone hydrolase family protein [Acidimicrobiales bacterium]|nr:dienelactone hydrolase family protein [Acidimicrobiales bacterium]
MPASSRTEQVDVADGSFDLHLWLPDSGRGPGLLLLQEIFGVGPYLRAVAERLADLGYVVGAPDVFWRIERNWEADHSEEGLTASLALMPAFDLAAGVADCAAAFGHLAALPEVSGGAGVMGFCLGGLLTFQVARAADPVVAVSYYGSNIVAFLDGVDEIRCPIQLHFGEHDPYIPLEQVEQIRGALAGRADAEVHVQAGAGHAFDNHEAPMFHDPAAAAAAWALTTAFLGRHLPVRPLGE